MQLSEQWKTNVEVSLAEIKKDIKYIIQSMPKCEKHTHLSMIKQNRRLFYIILITYIPIILAYFMMRA